MESIRLYDTLVQVLGQHRNWLDLRHLKTLAWMMVGLIQSGDIGLSDWAVYVKSRAALLASIVRRFVRWLDNERIEVHPLYGPLLQQALSEWGNTTLYVAFDTSMLWNTYCIIRLSLVYRGRAIPIIWRVLKHSSANVSYQDYKDLLDKAAKLLFPFAGEVIFLADRGFADTKLMKHLKKLNWHFRIRIKSNFWVYFPNGSRRKANSFSVSPGHAQFWHNVQITDARFGNVYLALGWPSGSKDCWLVVSDEPTSLETFQEYGLRFDIEENFLDDKSNGFQLESSLIRSPQALERLCFVLAMTTLYLVSQGTQIVEEGKRRTVDSHWFRGSSYLKIGWKWVKRALSRGDQLIQKVCLSPKPDPEPAMASRKQHQKRSQPRFILELPNAA